MVTHSLGFSRMGLGRELKTSLEAFFNGRLDGPSLETTAAGLRLRHWTLQRDAGIDLVPVGDFSLYDHMLDTALLFGVVPERHGLSGEPVDLAAYFRLARGGRDARGAEVTALEMTKWFDTNYHYLVPEFAAGQTFRLDPGRLLGQVREAVTAGFAPKVVLPGPLTFLTLGKAPDGVDRLDLLPGLLDAYAALLALLARECPWIELDEPILVQDLPRDVAHAFPDTYRRLVAAAAPAKVLLAT